MRKNCVLAVLYIIVAAMGFTSCKSNQKKEENETKVTPELSVLPKGTVTFSSNAERVDIGGRERTPLFTVDTNQDAWNIVSDQDWVMIEVNGNQFTLSAKPNTEIGKIYTASVTVSVSDSIKVVIPVTQQCVDIEDSPYAPIALVVGHGYDVTQRFAYSPDIKGQVLDFMELYKANLIKKDNNLRTGKFQTYAGKEIKEYTNDLAISAGMNAGGGVEGICYFQTEVSTQFKTVDYTKDAYSFATVQAKIVRDAYFVDTYKTPSKLQKYVSPAFMEDLQNKPAKDIIEIYGTHVMLGGLWGARLDHHFSVKKKVKGYSENIGSSLKVKAEATIKGVTGSAGMNSDVEKKYEECYETSTEEINTQTYGGDPEQGMSIHTSQDYQKWIDSISGNEVWCNYYPETLIPIYEFVENERLRNELKKAYENYLKGKDITVTSAKKTTVKRIPFKAQGGASRVGGDDNDINSKNGRSTEWQLSVQLLETSSNPKANIKFWVRETHKNYTELQLNKNEIIPLNVSNYMLDANTIKDWSSRKESIGGERHDWISINQDCPFMENVKIRIDGDGDDLNNIGVQGNFVIKYSYVE